MQVILFANLAHGSFLAESSVEQVIQLANLAHLVEQFPRKEQVLGSSPGVGLRLPKEFGSFFYFKVKQGRMNRVA